MNQQIFSRRSFLKLAGGTILTLASGCAFTAAPVLKPVQKAARVLTGDTSLEADYIRQLITADSRTSRTIMWQSNEEQKGAEVAWRLSGSETAAAVPAAEEEFRDDGTTVWLHTAGISGLEPGQRYEYRILCGEAGTAWYPLATDDGGAFKLLVFPDSQSNDYSGWKQLAQDAARRNPDAALFVNMGDLVDNGEDHTQWNAWFDAVGGIIDRIPLAAIMGNHETYDQKWKVRLPEAYLHEFAVPANGSGTFDRYYYSFDYGEVHFSVLNTQWDETEEFKAGLLDAQLDWLPGDIRASRKKWHIVLMHKDVLTYGIHSRPERVPGISEEGRAFMPLFDELGVDLVFSAHLHTYRNRGRLYHFARSQRGPLYILTGVAGNVRYPGLWIDHELDQTIAPQPETDNYLTLEASADSLRIQCFLPDGTRIDDASITK